MSPLDMTHYVNDGCPGGHRDLCGTPGFDHYWADGVCLLCGAARP